MKKENSTVNFINKLKENSIWFLNLETEELVPYLPKKEFIIKHKIKKEIKE